MSDERLWHVANAGGETGPMSTAQFLQAVSAGRVPPSASAWTEGMAQWQRVADIPEAQAILGRRGFDAMPRRQLLVLGGLSVASAGLLFLSIVVRALAGHDVGAIWPGVTGAVAAPGVMMLWKAFRRRP